MNSLRQWMHETLGLEAGLYYKLAVTVVIVIMIWLIRRVTLYVVRKKVEDVRQHYHWRKIISYVTFFIGLLLIGGTWLEGVRALSTYLGLLSAGVAIALKDPIVNIAGWWFILWVRPFVVGDRIEIGGHSGDVIDMRIFQFSLLEVGNWVDADQSTGRILSIPNGRVFADTLANFTKGFEFIWDEIPVLVTFESDWEKARELLLQIGNRHAESFTEHAEKQVKKAANKFMIFYRKLTPIVYTTVKDSGVLLTVRYLVEPRSRRGINQAIWKDILREFAGNDDIDFAYPTTRFYNNVSEGKPGKGSASGAGGKRQKVEGGR